MNSPLTQGVVCFCAAGLPLLLFGGGSSAATFTISDGNVSALQAAIITANANGEDDTIELAPGGTYTLIAPFGDPADEEGLPLISADNGHKLILRGNGATIERSAASGTPVFRIFHSLPASNVAIGELTVKNGSGDGFGDGNGTGALLNTGGTVLLEHCILRDNIVVCCGSGAVMNDGTASLAILTVNDCEFSGNRGVEGGAIFNNGGSDTAGSGALLAVRNSRLLNNYAEFAGAISNYGTFAHHSAGASATILDSTFTGNSANNYAGSINNETTVNGHATLVLSNCTISNSIARGSGGALYNAAGDAEIANCTFYGNSAAVGGAIYVNYDGAITRIRNATFSGNSASNAGGTIYRSGDYKGVVLLANTVLNGASANMLNSGTFGVGFQSQGYNICNTTCGGYLTAATDKPNTNPILDPAGLQDNGGPTKTIALLSDSPAINAANDSVAPSHDQRHFARHDQSDMGAFEYGGAPTDVPVLSAVSRKLHNASGMFDIALPLSSSIGIESRSGETAGKHTVILTFANELASVARANLASGTGRVANSRIDTDPHQYVVNLADVGDAQQVTVTLTDVLDANENYSSAVFLPVGILLGDANGDGFVNSADATITRNRSGQSTDVTNFRTDYNLDGVINAADATTARARSGPISRSDRSSARISKAAKN